MNNFDTKVASIQEKRTFFINSFSLDFVSLEKNLYSAISDNELNSIRLHKYMTETKRILLQLHEEDEELVVEKPWRNGSPLRE